VSVDPTTSPVLNNGGWVFNAAELLALLGIVLTVAIVFGYMRLAPRFQTDEQTRRSVRVPRMQPGQEVRRPVKVIGTPIIVQPPVLAPAVAGGPAAAAAPVVAAPAPAVAPPAPPAAAPAAPAAEAAAPAAPAAEAAAPAAPAAEAAPAAQAAAPAAAPAAAHAEVSLDQETFDRVLAELLEKGTDRRVAEGQARRAAMIAARKKAEG
jgi:cytoskeletal protein RodZ